MAMLHELVKNGVSAKLKRGCCTYIWNGNQLMYDNEAVKAGNAVILDKNWELDQPTVEDVLRERGIVGFYREQVIMRFKKSEAIVHYWKLKISPPPQPRRSASSTSLNRSAANDRLTNYLGLTPCQFKNSNFLGVFEFRSPKMAKFGRCQNE